MSSLRLRHVSVLGALVVGCATSPPPAPLVVGVEQKLSWILRLEDQRVLRDPAPSPVAPAVLVRSAGATSESSVPDLARLLEDRDARIRRRAALAIGRVGLAEGVLPLLPLLASDPEPEVRQMAAFALGLIGAPSAAEPLVAALLDPEPLVQGRAAQALGLIGATTAADAIGRVVAAHVPAASAIAPDELGYPLEPSVEAFRLGVYALGQLKAYSALAAATLEDGVAPRVRWWPMAYALQRVEDPRAFDALLSFVQGEGTYGPAFAARGLGTLKNPAALSALLPLVDAHRDSRTAGAAIGALAASGAHDAVPALVQVVATPDLDPNVRLEAVTALGELRARDAIDLFLDLLSDPWPAMRASAVRALARIDSETFVLVLSTRDPDVHWSVRAALAEALETIDAAVAVPRLTAMLDDSDRRVIPAVLAGLVHHRAPNVDVMLIERLESPDVVVRMRAAQLIGEIRPSQGPAALEEAYELGVGDTTYVARAAAVDALAAYGLAAAKETLASALADKDWAVRLRAAEHLVRMDPDSDAMSVIRPAPARLTAAGYEDPSLVQPSVSPHVYIETEKGTIQLELAVLEAPITVHSFIALVRAGFYSGLSIHRVVRDFVAQAGDPRGDGEGGPGFTLRNELGELPYLRGTVGIATDWEDTGGSQFFITHSPQPQLDARYTVIGRVIDGMAVVDRLQQWDVIRSMSVWDGATN